MLCTTKGEETLQTRQQHLSSIPNSADADAAKGRQRELLIQLVVPTILLTLFLLLQTSLPCRLILTVIFLCSFSTGGNRWVVLGCYVTAAVTDFLTAVS